jgi:hypothetical protein
MHQHKGRGALRDQSFDGLPARPAARDRLKSAKIGVIDAIGRQRNDYATDERAKRLSGP